MTQLNHKAERQGLPANIRNAYEASQWLLAARCMPHVAHGVKTSLAQEGPSFQPPLAPVKAAAALVQITPAPVAPPQRATLPPELLERNGALYERSMKGIDLQDQALMIGDAELLKRAHNAIWRASRSIRQKFCSGYRYPAPDATDPQRWEVLCESGKKTFFRKKALCTQCAFFDHQYNPAFASSEAQRRQGGA